jgi:hypothetical protein
MKNLLTLNISQKKKKKKKKEKKEEEEILMKCLSKIYCLFVPNVCNISLYKNIYILLRRVKKENLSCLKKKKKKP